MRKFQRKTSRTEKKKQFLMSLKHKKSEEQKLTDCSASDCFCALPYQSSQVIQRILFLGVKYKLQKQTTYLALTYFNIYQSLDIRWYTCSETTKSKSMTVDSSKKLALALIVISSKFNDIYNLSIDEVTRSYGEQFKQSIVILEQKILEILDFQFPQQTPYTVFYNYCEGNENLIEQCCEIFDKLLLNEKTRNQEWQILAKCIAKHLFPQKYRAENDEISIKMKMKLILNIVSGL